MFSCSPSAAEMEEALISRTDRPDASCTRNPSGVIVASGPLAFVQSVHHARCESVVVVDTFWTCFPVCPLPSPRQISTIDGSPRQYSPRLAGHSTRPVRRSRRRPRLRNATYTEVDALEAGSGPCFPVFRQSSPFAPPCFLFSADS